MLRTARGGFCKAWTHDVVESEEVPISFANSASLLGYPCKESHKNVFILVGIVLIMDLLRAKPCKGVVRFLPKRCSVPIRQNLVEAQTDRLLELCSHVGKNTTARIKCVDCLREPPRSGVGRDKIAWRVEERRAFVEQWSQIRQLPGALTESIRAYKVGLGASLRKGTVSLTSVRTREGKVELCDTCHPLENCGRRPGELPRFVKGHSLVLGTRV